MKQLAVATTAILALAGCSSGPSLDQQQQAWEHDVERSTCETWHRVGEDFYATRSALDTLATGQRPQAAEPQLNLDGCTSIEFGQVLHSQLVRQFPNSPKGEAGETTPGAA